jgi:hypothetical protein
MREISWQTEDVFVFQEGPCSMELVISGNLIYVITPSSQIRTHWCRFVTLLSSLSPLCNLCRLVSKGSITANIAVSWHVANSALGRVVTSRETPMLFPRVRPVTTVTVPRNRGLCQFPKTSSVTLVSPARNGTPSQMPYQYCRYSYLLGWCWCLCCIFSAGDQWTVLRGLDHSKWTVLDLVEQSTTGDTLFSRTLHACGSICFEVVWCMWHIRGSCQFTLKL